MAKGKLAGEGEVLERAALVALALAAVVIAALMVRREFWPSSAPDGRAQVATARHLENYDLLLESGIRLGDPNSRATIGEFADFECPFCRRFHSTYDDLKRRFGDDLSLVFIHYPLPSHRFARPAARAAECAETQGRFADYARLLFLKQDSLGLKSWSSFASEAGIQDTLAFARCASDTVVVQRIENGLSLGEAIGLRGTPTVILNGRMYSAPPNSMQLQREIQAVIDKVDPGRYGTIGRGSQGVTDERRIP